MRHPSVHVRIFCVLGFGFIKFHNTVYYSPNFVRKLLAGMAGLPSTLILTISFPHILLVKQLWDILCFIWLKQKMETFWKTSQPAETCKTDTYHFLAGALNFYFFAWKLFHCDLNLFLKSGIKLTIPIIKYSRDCGWPRRPWPNAAVQSRKNARKSAFFRKKI